MNLGGYKLINKTIVYIMALAIVGLSVVGIVSADPSPNGPGQPGAPGVACGSSGATNQPAGFLTPGFTFAGTVYAGSDGTASQLHANSSNAVSQYDIACFQVSQSHP
jgi:hypothetical protein